MSGVPTGTDVRIGDTVPRSFTPGDTGVAFVLGISKRGLTDRAIRLSSLPNYVRECGGRVANGLVYDTLDVAFREGLGLSYFVRLVGKEAKAATGKVKDGAGEGAKDTLEIVASSEGEWGDDVDWKIIAGSAPGAFRLVFIHEGDVETSPDLTTNAEAVAWAATEARYARVKDLAGGNPVVSEGSLSGGDDDLEAIDGARITEALELFKADLGPGQVAAPGYTTEAVHKAVIEHCAEHERTPILDAEDTGNVANLLEDAAALRALPGGRHGGVFWPWEEVPGVSLGTTRIVPKSASMLGLIAAADRENGHANIAVAGPMGKSSYALDVTQTCTEAERAELNGAGVNVSVLEEGQVTNKGFRTLANPVTNKPWITLSGARLMMGIAFGVLQVLKRKEFANLDAQGDTRGKAEGMILLEVVQPLYEARAIFGETPADACSVTVEQDVNPSDGTVGRLTGTTAAKPAPFNERIEHTVVNYPINEAL
jgi:hypothetical protein